MKKLLTYSLILISVLLSYGQEDKPFIGLIESSSNGVAQLRWFPSTLNLYNEGVNHGYDVFRITVTKNGQDVERRKEVKLNKKPIIKIASEEWDKIADTSKAMSDASILGNGIMIGGGEDLDQELKNYEDMSLLFALAGIASNQSLVVASNLGLYFKDESIVSGEEYIYVVRLHKASQEYKAGKVFSNPAEETRIPTPYKMTGLFDEEVVALQWNKNYGLFSFSHWNIYRSTHPKKNFEKVNDIPFISVNSSEQRNKNFAYYSDSLPEKGVTYYYKVQGVTPFGELSEFSNVIEGQSIHRLMEIPRISSVHMIENMVNLKWEFIEEERQYVDHYVVQRVDNPLDEFVTISENIEKDREFMDPSPLRNNYYRVCAYGIAGDVACSPPYNYTLVDSIPPSAPVVLEGKADTNGVVTFSWQANQEQDLYGYRIYRANAANEEYRRITPGDVQDTSYSDTINLKLLYKKVFYKIVAIDDHYNPSQLSEPLVVKRPDMHPPTAPIISKYKSTINGIVLEWKSSGSKDVVKQVLYRQGPIDANFRPIKEFTSIETRTFIDNDTEESKWYKYRIYAFDDYGNQSEDVQPVRVQQVMNPIKDPVQNLQGLVSRPHRQIKVYWEETNKGVDYFTVYRKRGDGPLKKYKTVAGNKREFFDTNILPDSEYTYMIITDFKNGARSKRSEELTLSY